MTSLGTSPQIVAASRGAVASALRWYVALGWALVVLGAVLATTWDRAPLIGVGLWAGGVATQVVTGFAALRAQRRIAA